MKLQSEIGQLFMFGFEGPDPGPALDLIDEFRPGGLILFHSNCVDRQQIRELTDRVQEKAREVFGTELLIAMDQEGGRVRILPDSICPPTSSNIELGVQFMDTGSSEATRQQAHQTAQNMLELGINMNLAPVLDVVTVEGNTVIADRAYGADPDLVSALGVAYIKTIQNAGVIATSKHYPGHGHTSVDSHLALPLIDMGEEEYLNIHQAPFRAAIEAGVDAVMTAHIVFKGKGELPATMSPELINGELRDRLGFNGAVITDDMNMLAIADNFSAEKATVAAINAGVDQILVCRGIESQRKAWQSGFQAVEQGVISQQTIDLALGRIASLKQKRGLQTTGLA